MGQYKGCIPKNTGKRICDQCRHYFAKANLRISRRGQFCRVCYQQKFGVKENEYDDKSEIKKGIENETKIFIKDTLKMGSYKCLEECRKGKK